MQLVLFGFIDQTIHDLPTAVVDQDRSVESRLFRSKLRATQDVQDRRGHRQPRAGARSRSAPGARAIAVVIPPRFHDRRVRGDEAQVLVLIDGSDSTASAQALASVNGLVASDNAGPPRGRRPRPGRARGAADHPVQPRGADRELHHPGPRGGAAAAGRHRAVGGRDRARARARHLRAAAGHADRSARPDAGEAVARTWCSAWSR